MHPETPIGLPLSAEGDVTFSCKNGEPCTPDRQACEAVVNLCLREPPLRVRDFEHCSESGLIH
jgi:hypothetical protein